MLELEGRDLSAKKALAPPYRHVTRRRTASSGKTHHKLL
jgi:hypothetical protein